MNRQATPKKYMAYPITPLALAEQKARRQARRYTALMALLVGTLLAFGRFSASPNALSTRTQRVDSLQVAYLPLELATRRRVQTQEFHQSRTTPIAAPVARYTPVTAPARPAEGPTPGNSRPIITTNVPEPVDVPAIDQRGLYRKVDRPGNGTDPAAKTTDGGNPRGQADGQVAGPGGTGGIGLDLSGFRFGRLSVNPDPYDETGRIDFLVKVDAGGRILNLSVANASVSPLVVQWYREQLQAVRLLPTSAGNRPDVSIGHIRLKIEAH